MRFEIKLYLLSGNKVAGRQCFQSCVSVSSHGWRVHKGPGPWPHPYRTPAFPQYRVQALPPPTMQDPFPSVQGPGRPPRHVQTCSLGSTYGWQADDRYPTGMLSRFLKKLFYFREFFLFTIFAMISHSNTYKNGLIM